MKSLDVWVDIMLIALLIGFGILGFMKGGLRQLAAITGWAAGLAVAIRWSPELAELIRERLLPALNETTMQDSGWSGRRLFAQMIGGLSGPAVVSWIPIIGIRIVGGWTGKFLNRMLRPGGLFGLNRLAGAAAGVLEGGLIGWMILHAVVAADLVGFPNQINTSMMAAFYLKQAEWLAAGLREIWRAAS